MAGIDWEGATGFLVALGAFVTVIASAGLSVATFIRAGRVATEVKQVAKLVDGQLTRISGLLQTSTASEKSLSEEVSHAKGVAMGVAQERADPQVHAVSTVKDENAPQIPNRASKPG